MLPESEARKLAIVFEETAKYQREQQRKAEQGTSPRGGLEGQWEQTFEFGRDDPNDYWDRPDITEGRLID